MSRTEDRVLVTGGKGMLAWDLTQVFSEHWGVEQVTCLSREELDIADAHSVLEALSRYRPRLVINAAGYTDVDGAESHREEAYRSNAVGPGILSQACKESGARLVHFSTDQVFDGTGKTPRGENDPTSPVNYYGESKLIGETEVLKNPEALVLRVQWLYGERKDRFTPLRAKEVFTPFSDQFGCPTWTRSVAEAVLKLSEKNTAGLFHFAYDDHASWAEVFAFVCETLQLSTKLVPSPTAPAGLPARRPLFSVMANRKLCAALGVSEMGSWKTPLRAFLLRKA